MTRFNKLLGFAILLLMPFVLVRVDDHTHWTTLAEAQAIGGNPGRINFRTGAGAPTAGTCRLFSLYLDTTGHNLYTGASDGTCTLSGSSTGITGTGTANTVALFTGASALGNSLITQDAGANNVSFAKPTLGVSDAVGACSTPTYSFTGATTSGYSRQSNGVMWWCNGGAGAYLDSAFTLGTTHFDVGASGDTVLNRVGASILGLGSSTSTNTFQVTTSSGLVTTYGNAATAGNGVASIVAVTSSKTETGADTTLLSYTPPAVASSYEVCIALDVSAANTATLGWTMTWTNSKGTALAPTNMSLFQMGVAAPALAFTAAASNSYYQCVPISINNAGTAIVVKTTFTGTSIAYNATATIRRLI